jgi:rhamnosyltransferase
LVAAIVVLYFPDRHAVQGLVRSLEDQVDFIFVIDNTPMNELAPEEELFPPDFKVPLNYTAQGENTGIAAAQNSGIRQALAAGASHVILFDQDSALPPKMVESLLVAEANLLSKGVEVAAVGPQFVDEKSGRPSPAIRHRYFRIQKLYLDPQSTEPFETDHLIASGSIIRASVLQKVGLMRDDFFIDWVDIEWGMRARSVGYKSYYAPNVVMKHSVGDSVVTVLGRDVHVHNDLRNYYMLRNAIYLYRLKSMGWRWKINFIPRIPCYLVLYPILSKHKILNLRYLIRGIWDGARGRLGQFQRTEERV